MDNYPCDPWEPCPVILSVRHEEADVRVGICGAQDRSFLGQGEGDSAPRRACTGAVSLLEFSGVRTLSQG